jgi:dynein heavy chain
LTFVLKEYDRVLQRIIPVIKPLLKPHLEDLNGKLQPGMLVLTWQSMNIDGYLHRIHLGLQKLDELVSKVNDIIENRIESNIKLISKTSFVDLPDNETFTLEQFVVLQEKVTKRKTKFIEAKNVEVERAVSDLITSVQNTTLDVVVQVDDQAVRLRDHYSRVMYLAILQATKYSLFLLKSRLTSRISGGFIMLDRPFFDVNVELNAPNVTMNPPLEEIQSAINRCAIHVLRVSKRVYQWGGGKDKAQSFNQLIAKDKEIVKVVLFLTGSVEGTKKQVNDYLGEFFKYDFLWLQDKVQSYKAFCDSKPNLEQFDLELKKYMQIEREIGDISLFQNIGKQLRRRSRCKPRRPSRTGQRRPSC